METNRWQNLPTFLSLREGCTEETADFVNDGIYYPDYIRGFLADLSYDKRVQIALSMFQVVPEDFTPLDENWTPDQQYKTVFVNYPIDNRIEKIIGKNKKIIRIDSGTFINSGICCGIFRDCNCNACKKSEAKAFCYKQDSRIGIFADKSLRYLDARSHGYEEQLQNVIKFFNQNEKEKTVLKLKKHKNRIYVPYTCEVSLFEETMFPIYANGKFVACLMLGQMAGENYDKSGSFKDFLTEEHTKEELQKFEINLPKRKLSKEEWNDKLDAIVERIIIFEKRLEDKIDHRSEFYINDEFRKIKEQFYTNTKDINIKNNNIPVKFYNALSNALTSIHRTFDANIESFNRIFALPMDTGSKNFVPIGWSEETINYWQKQNDYYFEVKPLKSLNHELNFPELTREQMKKIVDSAASKEIKRQYNSEKDIIRIEKLVDDSISFIVWKRHGNTEMKNFDIYKKALISFYTTAFQCYSYIRGAKMEYVLESTIRATAHESAHFILPALNIVEEKMEIIPEEMILPVYAEEYAKCLKDYEHYKDNVIELLNQLSEINTRPSLIFRDVILTKESVQIFPLLYKMRKMMSDKAYDKHCRIEYNQTINYVEVNLDPVYFNHAIFNLIDNAIKYGYDGSYIYLNMNKNKDELIIEVISYGREIEEGYRIYKLFERGTNCKDINGLGIGMFIVDKICKAHRGTVKHTSKLISPLNIPVLNCYLHSQKEEFLLQNLNREDREKILNEENKITQETFKKVVYDNKFIKYPNVFANRIFNATYENTFTITIPIK